jgi:hypothetical protein
VPSRSETRQSLPSLRVGLTLKLPNGVPTDAPKAYLQLQAYDEQGRTDRRTADGLCVRAQQLPE